METDRKGSLERNVQHKIHKTMKKGHHKNVQNRETIQHNEGHLITTSQVQNGNIPTSIRTVKVLTGSKTVLFHLKKKRKGY